jgi:hypothetical protein
LPVREHADSGQIATIKSEKGPAAVWEEFTIRPFGARQCVPCTFQWACTAMKTRRSCGCFQLH